RIRPICFFPVMKMPDRSTIVRERPGTNANRATRSGAEKLGRSVPAHAAGSVRPSVHHPRLRFPTRALEALKLLVSPHRERFGDDGFTRAPHQVQIAV